MNQNAQLTKVLNVLRSIFVGRAGGMGPFLHLVLGALCCVPTLYLSVRLAGIATSLFGILAFLFLSARIARNYWIEDSRLPLIFAFAVAVCASNLIMAIGVVLVNEDWVGTSKISGTEVISIGRFIHLISLILLSGPVLFESNRFGFSSDRNEQLSER